MGFFVRKNFWTLICKWGQLYPWRVAEGLCWSLTTLYSVQEQCCWCSSAEALYGMEINPPNFRLSVLADVWFWIFAPGSSHHSHACETIPTCKVDYKALCADACPWSSHSVVLSLFSGTCTSPTCRKEPPRLSVQPWMAQREKCFSQLA